MNVRDATILCGRGYPVALRMQSGVDGQGGNAHQGAIRLRLRIFLGSQRTADGDADIAGTGSQPVQVLSMSFFC